MGLDPATLMLGLMGVATSAASVLAAPKPAKPPPLPGKPLPTPIQESADVHIGQDDPNKDNGGAAAMDFVPTRKAAVTTGSNLGRGGLSL